MNALMTGAVLGLSIAAPVGPIGVLCIRRTLADGRASGFVSGLGAATADATYGAVAAFGLTSVNQFLVGYQTPIRIGGCAFLLYLAAKTFFARPSESSGGSGTDSLWRSYASTLALTLTNPATILSFVAVFAGLGVGAGRGDYVTGSAIVLGVFVGSALWWLILAMGIGVFRHRFDSQALRSVNRVSGIIIALLGLWSLAHVVAN